MSDLESRIASLSPAKRAVLERALREKVGRIETDTRQRPEHWSSLVRLQPKGDRLPFFWIHGDSSNAFLAAVLPPDQPLYGLEHQSIDGRPAHYTQVETIAKHYLDEIRSVRPRGPYALGGYCFGAVIAFEMAQQLKRDGQHVSLVFMLDPPGVKPEPVSMGNELHKHWRQLAALGPAEKVHYLLARVSSKVSDSFNVRTKWIRKKFAKARWRYCLQTGRLLPVSLRSPYILDVYKQAMQSYEPQPYSGRVLLFKARLGSYQPRLNWVDLAAGQIEIHEHAGDHMALREEAQVQRWATILKSSLDRAQRSAGIPLPNPN